MHATCPPARSAAVPHRGAPPGREAPDAPEGFAALLDSHSARTAIAEGQTPQSQGEPLADGPAVPAEGEAAAAPTGVVVADPSLGAPLAGVPAPAAEAPVVALPAPTGEAPAAPAIPLELAMTLTASPATAAATAAGEALAPAGSEAAAGKGATPAVPAVPAVPASKVDGEPGQGATPATPATPAVPASAAKDGEATGEPATDAGPAGAPKHDNPGLGRKAGAEGEGSSLPAAAADGEKTAPTAGPAASTAKAEPEARSAAIPAVPAAPASPGVSGAAPATPATPAAPAQPAQPAVPLHRAAHTVGQLLQVAHDRGVTHARLALKPADLGGIEIRLQTSSAGVTAQVIADSPEATRLLQQAGSELRRSLEDAGVNLLSLDVSTNGEDRSAAAMAGFAAHAEARERDRHLNGSERGRSRAGRTEAVEDQPTRARTLELPGRVLVDVLA